jgi:hypothetical protein
MTNNITQLRIHQYQVRVRTNDSREYIGYITDNNANKLIITCNMIEQHKFDMSDILDVMPIMETNDIINLISSHE